MAKSGMLGKVSHYWSDSNRPRRTVYTVPDDVDHAVVHITLSPGGAGALSYFGSMDTSVLVDGVKLLSYKFTGIGYPNTQGPGVYNQVYGYTNSVSVMLSPGNKIEIEPTGQQGQAHCTVSGYEVD